MTAEQHSHVGWYKELARKSEAEQLSLSESMLLCLHNIQNHLHEIRLDGREQRAATEHMEGMVGAIDEMFSRHDPYYAGDGAVRAALDAKRDADRALADEERTKRLQEGAKS